MKVSIIVTYHGEELYIKDCFTSLCEQTYKDFEVVVVTSGSDITTDNINIPQELNVKLLAVAEENVAVARNAGLDAATGEYVMFLDCDDYLATDFLERLLAAEDDTHHDLLFGKINFTWYKRDFYTTQQTSEEDSDENEDTLEKDDIEIEDDTDVKAEIGLVSKRKTYSAITVLGVLYSRELLEKHNIRFDEELKYYCDMPFLARVLNNVNVANKDRQAVYIKRRHNDPIHFPSLLQEIGKEEAEYFIKSYKYVLENTESESELRNIFDKKLVNYYVTTVAQAIAKNEDKAWRKKHAPVIKDYIAGISNDNYKGMSRYKRKLITALKNNDYNKITKIVKKRNIVNGIKFLLVRGKFTRRFKELIYKRLYVKKPVVNNLVLFESFYGRTYSDNPKYIYERLNQMYPDKYQCVWIFKKKKKKLPYNAKQVKRYSFAYYKYLARAKYIVFNSRQPRSYVKRKETVFLETWHGTPLKRLVFDMEDVVSASPTYKKDFYYQSRAWDYLIAANGFSDEVFRRAFVFDKHMLKFGYPRNDILHADNKEEIAAQIKKNIGIPADKKVILYAPTWRDDEYYGKGKYKFSLKLNLQEMKKELGDEYVLILRTHYFIADSIDISGVEDFVYNLSSYEDVAEIYLISDLLITDYSSVFFDYANLRRPILFFTYDLDKYKDVLRGFYIDMEKEIPGPLVYNTNEIIDSIKNIDKITEDYSVVYDEFYERFCGWEDGKASENCIKEVFK